MRGLVPAALLAAGALPAAGAVTARIEGATLHVVGDRKADTIVLQLQAGVPTTLEIDIGGDGTPDLPFDRSLFTAILVEAGAGNDTVTILETNGFFTDTAPTTIDGGPGDDHLTGGTAAQTILGGPGDDLVHPSRGNDVVELGKGDDVVTWVPGDGSDVVEGEAGFDVLDFPTAAADEVFTVSANGARAQVLRNVGNIVMDLGGVEEVRLRPLGGADTVAVNDLTGTDVGSVVVDLGGAGDPPVDDGAEDVVTVATPPAADTLEIPVGTGGRLVRGLPWEVRVLNAEPALDRVAVTGIGNDRVEVNGTPDDDLVSILPFGGAARVLPDASGAPVDLSGALALAVYGFAGNDTIACANGLATTLVPIEIYGGKGDDALTGSNGSELIRGEAGDDVVTPAQGNDAVYLGPGVDQVLWSPGDGSDVVEGESGDDTLVFAASNGGEALDLSKLGRRLRLFRNVGNVTTDLGGVEQVDLRALGGADSVVVNDLRGTAVKRVNVDLAGTGGVDDAQVDAVVVQGTPRVDKIRIATDVDGVVVTRPRLVLRLLHPEALLDTLTVNGLAGADRIEAAPDVAARIGLTVNPD